MGTDIDKKDMDMDLEAMELNNSDLEDEDDIVLTDSVFFITSYARMLLNDNTQKILPWTLSAAAVGYALYATFVLIKKKRINKKIQLESDKIVHVVDIEDVGKKAVFCRCWKSEKFPYCDGSHNKHNECTGDNVGPLIVKQKDS
ncbi:CDGSH iron-sulfur domain-containing protein 1 [Caerostris extrusa]|uniref:CDGSH iron-sulfur domain-containing protein 2 homologue n=1 Tax=Caerostris extrusa TaxID=172846 RepID=A0AAV4YCH6_CAEEX|nr:CDGSH iron-sulfur domain-containing protein 1 [Caerostris extrusa]